MSRFYNHSINQNPEISSVAKTRTAILLEDLDRVFTSLMILKTVHGGRVGLHEEIAYSIRAEVDRNIVGSEIEGLEAQAGWLNAVADLLAPEPEEPGNGLAGAEEEIDGVIVNRRRDDDQDGDQDA